MKKFIFILSLLGLIMLFRPLLSFAKTPEEYDREIKDLEAKIAASQTAANTLANEITYYENQIALATLKIAQTEDTITSISGKINSLEDRLRTRSRLLQNQIVISYKQGLPQPVQLLFSSQDFSTFISRFKYLQLVQSNSRRFLHDNQVVQSNYQTQKTLIEDSRKRLQAQKTSLSQLITAKNTLLAQTKNDEATYEKLLAQAQSELASLRNFANFKGGGLLPPQPSPDGWYFNQRDERWGGRCIGSTCLLKSPDYIWQVGCLLTDVAMIFKKYGQDVTPLTIAANSGYFFSTTAYMLIPWPAPPGLSSRLYYGYRRDIIDSELGAGRPVVVHINMNNADGHFVILKSGSNGNYVMNDPWEGPDLNFSKFYSLGSITSVTSYTPS